MAHGGSCVVRLDPPEGRVVFTRHALPGETVTLEITEGTDGDRYWRADAVQVLAPSPDRVRPPCPLAGPGRCGGCDLQHVTPARQRQLKAEVVREQLSRLAGLDVAVDVEAVPGDQHGLRWRTRMRYAQAPVGGTGLRAHRSARVVPVKDCLLAHPDARVVIEGAAPPSGSVDERVEAAGTPADFTVAADGFWQVHPGAPRALVEAVLAHLAPRPGERALDLYAGVGLFARFLATALGSVGQVVAVEGDPVAVAHARENLAPAPDAAPCRVVMGPVGDVLASADAPAEVDLVVLDPPREGARAAVVLQIAARTPRAVSYVACDPAALARDAATFATAGYRLSALRALDLFPMTHHVECVALFEPDRG
ncbi:MAG: methyltransferase [Nocardioides sp.]